MQLVLELPAREEQIAFNRQRWEEICADPELDRWEGRVESTADGNLIMSPPPSGGHSVRLTRIVIEIHRLLGGTVLAECPISTVGGVRAADVGWYSEERFAAVQGQIAFEIAPEICVEVLSPRNRPFEIQEKKQLYFEAGAEEVWFCAEDGTLSFFMRDQSSTAQPNSTLCPKFPGKL